MKRLTSVLFLTLTIGVLTACSSPEEKAADYIENAQDLLEEGKLKKAEIEFKNALQINQNLVDAWYGIALIHESRKEWRKTYVTLNKIRELSPNHVEGRIKLAQFLLASKQLDEALLDAKEILEFASGEAAAHALMAAVHYRLENYEGARLEIDKALKIDPLNNEAQLVLARIYISQSNYDQAHKVIDAAIKSTPENVSAYLMKIQVYLEANNQEGIEAAYISLINNFPNILSYRHSLAKFYSDTKDIDKAEKIYLGLINDNPDNVEEKIRFVAFTKQYRSGDQSINLLKDYILQDGDETRYKFALGSLYEQIDMNSEATVVYQAIIDAENLRPDAMEARNKIALIELKSGNREKASLLIDEILANDKNNENALLIQSGLKITDKRFDDAIVDLRTILRDNPSSIKALSLLAKSYEAKGSNQLALENYLKVYRGNPGVPEAANQLASFYLRNRKISQANEVLEESLARGNRSLTLLKLMARTKLSLQEWGAAEKFSELLQKVEGQEALSQQMLGFVYQGKQLQEESIEAFKKAYELSPSSIQPVVALVRSYVQNGKLEEARNFLNTVLSVDAKNVNAYTLLGQLSLYEKQPEQAETNFRKSIEVNPEQVIGYRSLAQIYLADNQFDKAEKIIMRGLEAMPENSALGMNLASIYEKKKDFDMAIDTYEALLNKKPDLIIARNNLASLLIDHRTDKASLEKARRISSKFKDSRIPHLRDTYAWVQVKSDFQLEQAVIILEGVVKEAGDIPIFRYHLGKAYVKKGNSKKAREQLELAIEQSGKESEFYDDANSVINSLN
jgi:tetratricopeptide (TPR) repeat protein